MLHVMGVTLFSCTLHYLNAQVIRNWAHRAGERQGL